jgi:cytoskeleton protein RodZ
VSQEMDPKTQKLKEIGSAIREQRESLGLSIEDVREKTLIRRKYLIAVEEGDDSSAPAEVYFKGFLKSYASFVGLDGASYARQYQELLDQKADAEQQKPQRAPRASSRRPTPSVRRQPDRRHTERRHVERTQTETVARPRRQGSRRGRPALLLFLLLFVLALGAYYLTSSGILANVFASFGEKEPTETDPPDTNPPVTDPPDINPPDDPTPPKPVIARSDPNSESSVWECQNLEELRLTVKALDSAESYCWARITSDGQTVYEGTLVPGEKREVTGAEEIVVRAGRPWCITLELNGEDLGVGGELGPVKDLVFRIVPQSP